MGIDYATWELPLKHYGTAKNLSNNRSYFNQIRKFKKLEQKSVIELKWKLRLSQSFFAIMPQLPEILRDFVVVYDKCGLPNFDIITFIFVIVRQYIYMEKSNIST